MSIRRQEALDYHSQGRPGKIQVSPTKPFKNQRDLSLAYTPGVAEPCREIAAHPEDAYTYTAKGNLVAVVTNGTAVLGLGNIGALAGKPVMEGKGILFKAFADIDVFDLEVGSDDARDLVRFCQLLEPPVGGINLEDIRSPDCFYVEQALREQLSIPVFHDDQHGTAIITGAALLNALEIVKKDIREVRVVFAGAGAAFFAPSRLSVPANSRLMLARWRQISSPPITSSARAIASAPSVRTRQNGANTAATIDVKLAVGSCDRRRRDEQRAVVRGHRRTHRHAGNRLVSNGDDAIDGNRCDQLRIRDGRAHFEREIVELVRRHRNMLRADFARPQPSDLPPHSLDVIGKRLDFAIDLKIDEREVAGQAVDDLLDHRCESRCVDGRRLRRADGSQALIEARIRREPGCRRSHHGLPSRACRRNAQSGRRQVVLFRINLRVIRLIPG